MIYHSICFRPLYLNCKKCQESTPYKGFPCGPDFITNPVSGRLQSNDRARWCLGCCHKIVNENPEDFEEAHKEIPRLRRVQEENKKKSHAHGGTSSRVNEIGISHVRRVSIQEIEDTRKSHNKKDRDNREKETETEKENELALAKNTVKPFWRVRVFHIESVKSIQKSEANIYETVPIIITTMPKLSPQKTPNKNKTNKNTFPKLVLRGITRLLMRALDLPGLMFIILKNSLSSST